MILLKRILILEDNLFVLSKLLDYLATLEQNQPFNLSLVVLTDYQQVKDYINTNPLAEFDIILMDRDCKLNGSFHILDIERLGVEKVISISSVPKWNDELKTRGVTKVIEKDLLDVEHFARDVVKLIEKMIHEMLFI